MEIAIVLGTRPEIIKMAPLIRLLQQKQIVFFIIHSNQHYSPNMDAVFFNELNLPKPKYNLDVGSGTHAEETGKMLIGIEKILQKEKTDVVLVEGDTNTVLAGALAANKLHINVGHVEAGLRSNDRTMPEEINRILTDHLSDNLFAPTPIAKKNLLKEGINEEKIFITGNTIVDAVHENLIIARRKSNILNKLGISSKKYILVTAHRQENVDIKDKLENIFKGLKLISQEFNLPILYPIHPRTMKRIKEFKIKISKEIVILEPLGFLDFLELEANALIVATDSGGIQEETCILKVPCITLRENTERPETIDAGSNILVGTNPEKILKGARIMSERKCNWVVPFGDGTAGKKIIEIIQRNL
jgi:UDP-N-acetylglucosamine 2-epimerase (non-hydrolysing)